MTEQPNDEGGIGCSVLAPVLCVLNELVAGGFLTEYAIGGGIGVLEDILERYGLREKWKHEYIADTRD